MKKEVKAYEIVRDYIKSHSKSDLEFNIYTVRDGYMDDGSEYYLLATTLTYSDFYYHLMFVAPENKWYLNVYKKTDCVDISE